MAWRLPAAVKSALTVVALLVLLVAALLGALTAVAYQEAASAIAASPADLPPTTVALVLGASVQPDKKPSAILRDRVVAGVELLKLERVQRLLLSGDNREVRYNEVAAMRRTALELGAEPEQLVLDYAGRRTYDSCYRAKEIFGLSEVVIVTQRFHLPRAIYICSKLGVRAHGIAADRSSYDNIWRFELREWGAWFMALVDVYHEPEPVLGPREPIALPSPASGPSSDVGDP